MEQLQFTCPCHFGLESVLQNEMRRLGLENVQAENGRVRFTGDFSAMAKANLHLRTAERVQILLSSFTAQTFEELFDRVRDIPFEAFIGKSNAFPVVGYSLNSKLASVPACQSIIKKAVVKRLESKYHLSFFEETGATVRIQFSILKDQVSICLDTSGPGLHKRGYRQNANIAPIKETLAAGIVDLARIRGNSLVYDPFCGSGTLLIEAATAALSIAPGINRRFSFESWAAVNPKFITQERSNALDMVNKSAAFTAFGSDNDPEAVELTLANAKKAGISSRIQVRQLDAARFRLEEPGTLITNPPYGERMLDIQEAERLYKVMGGICRPAPGASYYIISPHEDFEKLFGRKADKRRKLYNGMIKCQLYMYFKA